MLNVGLPYTNRDVISERIYGAVSKTITACMTHTEGGLGPKLKTATLQDPENTRTAKRQQRKHAELCKGSPQSLTQQFAIAKSARHRGLGAAPAR